MKNKKIATTLLRWPPAGRFHGLLAVRLRQQQQLRLNDIKSSSTRPPTIQQDDSKSIPPASGKRFRSTRSTPDQEVGPLTVNAVYFQPIDMEPSGMGLKAADAGFHLEADIRQPEGAPNSATVR